MKYLFLFTPFLLAFNYKTSLNKWEIATKEVSAHKLSIRSGLGDIKARCDYEKASKHFPLSCFELLNSMKTLNPSYDYNEIEIELGKHCADKIINIVSMNQIKQIESKSVLTSDCKKRFLKQKEIIKYKLEI